MIIQVDDWRPAGGIVLEPNGLTAARELRRSVALTAGPGAGKSEVLAQRSDFLLRTNSCPFPKRILAISFKVDASRNLADRVRLRCGRDFAYRLDSRTFHGFAKRLIDTYRVVLTGEDALDADYSVGKARVPRRQITFMDMIPLATKILRANPAVRNAWADVQPRSS